MAHMKHFEHLKIQLDVVKRVTNNFANENCIGRGGFGRVYKGKITEHTLVALKRLDPRFGQGDTEFWKEVMMLSRYKHENIVSLLGFCDDSGEKILVYEYVPNKSLDYYLNHATLRWIRRLKICIGAARGLEYLHSAVGTQQRVLHRDIKSSNILLDEDWNAKISDFGLSKFGPANQEYTFLYSHAVGTLGYVDPLYARTGFLTKETDVYSFGVVLFEVLCGRLCMDNRHPDLIESVRKSYKENKVNEIVYSNIKDEINPNSLLVFATIAYQCLERNREERPLMSDIVVALETALSYQEARILPVTNSYFPPEDLRTDHPVANSYFPPEDLRTDHPVANSYFPPENLRTDYPVANSYFPPEDLRTDHPVANSYFPPEYLRTNHPVANSHFPPEDRATTSAVASKSEGAGLLVVAINQGVQLNVKHPYVNLRVGSELKQTTIKYHDQNPVWLEEFRFTLAKPAEAVLWLTVCSASQMDRFLGKDVLDSVGINIADVVREKHMTSIYYIGNGRIHVELHFQPCYK